MDFLMLVFTAPSGLRDGTTAPLRPRFRRRLSRPAQPGE